MPFFQEKKNVTYEQIIMEAAKQGFALVRYKGRICELVSPIEIKEYIKKSSKKKMIDDIDKIIKVNNYFTY